MYKIPPDIWFNKKVDEAHNFNWTVDFVLSDRWEQTRRADVNGYPVIMIMRNNGGLAVDWLTIHRGSKVGAEETFNAIVEAVERAETNIGVKLKRYGEESQ